VQSDTARRCQVNRAAAGSLHMSSTSERLRAKKQTYCPGAEDRFSAAGRSVFRGVWACLLYSNTSVPHRSCHRVRTSFPENHWRRDRPDGTAESFGAVFLLLENSPNETPRLR